MNIPTIEDAIALAVEAHRGATSKGGEPYILHVLRVMLAQKSEEARRVAVMHDVVEDTSITLEDLRRRGFPERELAAIDALTRRKDSETYEEFIARVKTNPLARRVKLADLADNLDVRRLAVVDEEARARLERYRRALRELEPEHR